MLIKCITKDRDLITDENECESQYYSDFSLLEVGEFYVVYAIYVKQDRGVSFHICGESYIPRHYPDFLFEIIDPRLSKFWVYGNYCKINHEVKYNLSIFSYSEWALNYREFWNKLVNGDKNTRKEFYHFKELIDHEYKIPSVKLHAAVVEDKWVKCPLCVNIWEVCDRFELVSCPQCNEVLINELAFDQRSFVPGIPRN